MTDMILKNTHMHIDLIMWTSQNKSIKIYSEEQLEMQFQQKQINIRLDYLVISQLPWWKELQRKEWKHYSKQLNKKMLKMLQSQLITQSIEYI